jgi:hypothetical protein
MALVSPILAAISEDDWEPGDGPRNPPIQLLAQQANWALAYAGPPLWHVGQRIQHNTGFPAGTEFFALRTWLRKGTELEAAVYADGTGDITVHIADPTTGIDLTTITIACGGTGYYSGSVVWEADGVDVLVYCSLDDDTSLVEIGGFCGHWLAAGTTDPTYLYDSAEGAYIAEHEWADDRALSVDMMERIAVAPATLYRETVATPAIQAVLGEYEPPTQQPRIGNDGRQYTLIRGIMHYGTVGQLRCAVRSCRTGVGADEEAVTVYVDGSLAAAITLTSVGASSQAMHEGWDAADLGTEPQCIHQIDVRFATTADPLSATHDIQNICIYEVPV